MKCISLFLMIMCFYLSSWAQKNSEYTYQPFIIDGTCEWIMPVYDVNFYRQTISVEDTVILGKTYKKIFSQDFGTTIRKYDGAIREDNKKIFYISSENNDGIKEKVLFDFNLKIGEQFCYNYQMGATQIEVARIDTVQIESEWRRRYYFYLLDDNGDKMGDDVYLFDSWIEGIGSEQGLLLPFHPIPTSFWNPRVACVHQGKKVLYRDYDNAPCYCDDGQSIEEYSQNKSYHILQNPIKDKLLSIELKDAVFSKIDIYSWDGKLLLTKDVAIRNGILEVPLTDLQAGNYIVILCKPNNSRESVQIIVL